MFNSLLVAGRLAPHSGFGGTLLNVTSPKKDEMKFSDPLGSVQKAKEPRSNPPNTEFRRHFERGDLPIIVEHTSSGTKPGWKVNVTDLDYHHFLPIFFEGLREKEEPYSSMALKGCFDMLRMGGSKTLPVVPQLILPMKGTL